MGGEDCIKNFELHQMNATIERNLQPSRKTFRVRSNDTEYSRATPQKNIEHVPVSMMAAISWLSQDDFFKIWYILELMWLEET